jgi:MFS transporter, UMF1 family
MTVLDRLGLHRPELRAWAMYDWANSAFQSTVITAIFPIYFTSVAAAGLRPADATRHLATATTIALTVAAVLAPILGAFADYAPLKKRMLAWFLGVGALAAAAMALVQRGDWMLGAVLFTIGNIGMSGSLTFYDSLLPHIAGEQEIDRVSTAGYALGYLGGGVLLALNLVWIVRPGVFGLPDASAASRLSFLSVAVWWVVFSLPLFRTVREPPLRIRDGAPSGRRLFRVAFCGLVQTLRDLRAYRQAFLLLVAFIVYSDGINTIIRMATSYGTELGLRQNALITAILIVQFVGIPCSFLFGSLAGWIGAKRSIFVALAVYTLTSVLGYYMKTERDFYVLAIMVATVQGGSQALGRSLFASMIPRDKSSEFFGFFSVFEKFGAILGPALFGLANLATGSSRTGILTVIVFFVAGGILLSLVDVDEGRRAAKGTI